MKEQIKYHKSNKTETFRRAYLVDSITQDLLGTLKRVRAKNNVEPENLG